VRNLQPMEQSVYIMSFQARQPGLNGASICGAVSQACGMVSFIQAT
jgi:hypothetical protein